MHTPSSDDPELNAWLALNTRPCVPLQLDNAEQVDASGSHFGSQPLMAANEVWPCDAQGLPLWCLMQLNLLQAPWCPPELCDLALVQLFASARLQPSDARTWVIRTRSRTQGVAELHACPGPQSDANPWVRTPRAASWQALQADHPTNDEPGLQRTPSGQRFPEGAWGQCHTGCKLGGYPYTVQHELNFLGWQTDAHGVVGPSPNEPSYQIQIDGQALAGDGWLIYLGQHPDTGAWALSLQMA